RRDPRHGEARRLGAADRLVRLQCGRPASRLPDEEPDRPERGPLLRPRRLAPRLRRGWRPVRDRGLPRGLAVSRNGPLRRDAGREGRLPPATHRLQRSPEDARRPPSHEMGILLGAVLREGDDVPRAREHDLLRERELCARARGVGDERDRAVGTVPGVSPVRRGGTSGGEAAARGSDGVARVALRAGGGTRGLDGGGTPRRSPRPAPRGDGMKKKAAHASKPSTVPEYLAGLSADKRAALKRLRRDILAAAPRSEECISYGLPAVRLDGRMLVWYGA